MSPPENETDIEDWIASLDAYRVHLQGDSEEALAQLSAREGPESIRRRLIVLLDSGLLQDALDLIEGREPHEAWCEIAVRTLAHAVQTEKALAILQWADDNASRATAHRCGVFYALDTANQIASVAGSPIPTKLTDSERERLQTAAELLSPILAGMGGRIENELESRAAQGAFIVQDFLGNRVETNRLATMLAERRPVPLLLAGAVLLKRIEGPPNLPERLRKEHPNSAGAKTRAVAIEGRDRPLQAYSAAKELARQLSSVEEQVKLGGVVLDLAQRLDDPRLREEAEKLGESLLADERYRQLLLADRSLKQGFGAREN